MELSSRLTQQRPVSGILHQGMLEQIGCMWGHALVQDAAYGTLLRETRRQLHGRIAKALEDYFPGTVETQPELIARHFTNAGLVDSAIDYWLKAGNLALSRSANAEAVKHLRRGMQLIESQAPTPQRVRKELDFYLALGPGMAATEGFAKPEPWKVFSHARDLLGNGGTPTERMTVLWGTYLSHSMQAEHSAALEVARELAAHREHPGMLALGNRFMGQTLNFMGAFIDARVHLEQALALCDANEEAIATYRRYGTDDKVTALAFLASTLLLLGYPEQSAAAAEEAVSLARAMGLAFTIALTLSQAAFLGTLGGDPQRASAYADETVAYCVKYGLADPAHRARFTQGALLAQGGDPQRGIDLMRSAIVATERRTLYLGHLASAHAHLGHPEIGLDLIDEAIQTAEITNERFFEAELYRLRGNLLLMLGKKGEAEAGLRRALTIAQQQQARWWELRAAISLAQHSQNEGKYLEAYSLLQPAYSQFDEGFDMAVLKDAKALLEELRQ